MSGGCHVPVTCIGCGGVSGMDQVTTASHMHRVGHSSLYTAVSQITGVTDRAVKLAVELEGIKDHSIPLPLVTKEHYL